MTYAFYYILLIVIAFFDQFPAYPEEAYEIGVVTPWSPITFIRLGLAEILTIVLVAFILVGYIARVKNLKEYFNRNIFKSHILLLLLLILGTLVGIIHQGFITQVFFQGRGILNAIMVFFVTLILTQERTKRIISIKLLILCGILKAMEGMYYWVFGGLGRTLHDGTPIIFYDLPSAILMLIVLFFAYYNFRSVNLKYKVLLLLSAIPALISFVFSFRRNLVVGVICAISVLVFKKMLLHKNILLAARNVIKIGLYIFAGLCLLYFIIPDKDLNIIVDRISSTVDINDSESASAGSNLFRVIEFYNVIENYYNNPIWGAGFGGRYTIYYPPIGPGALQFMEDVSNVVHNSYLGILYKLGAIGFIIFMVSLWMLFSEINANYVIVSDYNIVKISFMLFFVIFISYLFSPNIFFERIMSFPSMFYAVALNTIKDNGDLT
jgi:hypothetical protein